MPQASKAVHVPRMDRRSWKVLMALVGVALAVVGWMWWQGRAQPAAVIPDRVVASGSGSESSAASAASAASAPMVVVHVVGAVGKPGLVHLLAGSRVADALKAAGGASSTKAESSVNLARVVVDGEQIQVNASGVTAGTSAGGKVSLNSATAQEFEALPGVGPVLAQRIVDYRAAHGSFKAVDELDEVSGIGQALMGQLRAHVQM